MPRPWHRPLNVCCRSRSCKNALAEAATGFHRGARACSGPAGHTHRTKPGLLRPPKWHLRGWCSEQHHPPEVLCDCREEELVAGAAQAAQPRIRSKRSMQASLCLAAPQARAEPLHRPSRPAAHKPSRRSVAVAQGADRPVLAANDPGGVLVAAERPIPGIEPSRRSCCALSARSSSLLR